MPPFLRSLGIAALLALLTASSSSAGTNADARLLLHLTAPTVNPACSGSQAGPPCADAVTAGDLAPNTYYAYLLIGNTDPVAGVAGVQFGIEYNGAPGAGV